MNHIEKLEEATLRELQENNINEPSLEEIKEEVNDKLEFGVLSAIYDKYSIKHGDITPEQSLKWDELVDGISNLVLELFRQNND